MFSLGFLYSFLKAVIVLYGCMLRLNKGNIERVATVAEAGKGDSKLQLLDAPIPPSSGGEATWGSDQRGSGPLL